MRNSSSTGTCIELARVFVSAAMPMTARNSGGILFIREAFRARRGGVRMDAVAAAVSRGYRYIDQLFYKRIEHSGLNHHLFDAGPRPLKKAGLICQRFPQKLFTKSDLRVARMSSKTALTAGTVANFVIGPELYSGHPGTLPLP